MVAARAKPVMSGDPTVPSTTDNSTPQSRSGVRRRAKPSPLTIPLSQFSSSYVAARSSAAWRPQVKPAGWVTNGPDRFGRRESRRRNHRPDPSVRRPRTSIAFIGTTSIRERPLATGSDCGTLSGKSFDHLGKDLRAELERAGEIVHLHDNTTGFDFQPPGRCRRLRTTKNLGVQVAFRLRDHVNNPGRVLHKNIQSECQVRSERSGGRMPLIREPIERRPRRQWSGHEPLRISASASPAAQPSPPSTHLLPLRPSRCTSPRTEDTHRRRPTGRSRPIARGSGTATRPRPP